MGKVLSLGKSRLKIFLRVLRKRKENVSGKKNAKEKKIRSVNKRKGKRTQGRKK